MKDIVYKHFPQKYLILILTYVTNKNLIIILEDI